MTTQVKPAIDMDDSEGLNAAERPSRCAKDTNIALQEV